MLSSGSPTSPSTSSVHCGYTANTTSARTFTLNSGTMDVSSGATLTLNGAAIGGEFVHGPGTISVTDGTAFVGVIHR